MIITTAKRLQSVKEYYFSIKLQQIAQMKAQGADIINIGIGSPDLAPSEETISTLVEAAQQPNNHGYQSYKGIPELRNALAAWMSNTYGIQKDAATEILPLMGSKEGIMHISMAFLNPGDRVLVPNPGYPTYASVSKLVQAEIVSYELDESNGWGIDFEQLEKIDLDQIKLMWVNFPNMPTGAQMDLKAIQRLVDLAKKHQFLIVNDNPYSLILNPQPVSALEIEGADEVLIELNSLSKSHNMAGWRIGWITGREDYLKEILKVKSNMDSGMFKPMQLAAVTALNNSKEWHQKQNANYAERRELVWQLFDQLKCTYSREQVGLFIWAKLPETIEDNEAFVEDILQKAHVFITPGFIFGNKGDRYLRISLCANQETLIEVNQRIENYINKV